MKHMLWWNLMPPSSGQNKKHNNSFRFMDCRSSVIRLHEEKFSSDQTKCESTVVNVLVFFTMQQISEELENVM
jgi:hypothetical protein